MIALLLVLLMLSGTTAAATKSESVAIIKAVPAENAMGKAKAVATRKAGALSISYGGMAVARFTNIRPTECAGSGICSIWTFDSLIEVFDQPTGKLRTLALLRWESGEYPQQYVFVYSNGAWHELGITRFI